MATLKIEIDPKALRSSEWSSHIALSTEYFPRVYRVTDGSCKVYLCSAYYVWLPAGAASTFLSQITDTATLEILPAPNPGISESTLLKALAIAQNPNLAYALLKI